MKTLNALLFLIFVPLLMMAQEIDENFLENATYKERMTYFKTHPLKKGQVVFFGNSITQGGDWSKYFPAVKPANRGIAGDNTEGMLSRMHEVIAAQPSKLFIMAGVNDISLNRDNTVIIRQMKMLLRQVKAGSPNTKIYVQSALPICNEKLAYSRMKGKEVVIENYNTLLKQLCNEMDIPYLDIYSLLLIKPLTLSPAFTGDGLHLNKDAYLIWTNYIKAEMKDMK